MNINGFHFHEGLFILKLLQEFGIQKLKGIAFLYVPVYGVLNVAFKRVTYQVKEYDQSFVNNPGDPDLLDFGLKEIADGVLIPILNQDFVPEPDVNSVLFIIAEERINCHLTLNLEMFFTQTGSTIWKTTDETLDRCGDRGWIFSTSSGPYLVVFCLY